MLNTISTGACSEKHVVLIQKDQMNLLLIVWSKIYIPHFIHKYSVPKGAELLNNSRTEAFASINSPYLLEDCKSRTSRDLNYIFINYFQMRPNRFSA
jgi:hypothetical protein